MGGSAWRKAIVGVLVIFIVSIGWNAWTKRPESGDARIPTASHSRVVSPSQTPAAAVIVPTTAPTPEVVSLGDGVSVRGSQLIDSAGNPVRLLGVGTSETNCGPGQSASAMPLDSTEAQAIASWHLNAVRIGLNEDCWLGINGVKAAYSGLYYQNRIRNWVAALNADGIVAILDLQFSAPGTYPSNVAWPMPDEDHSPTFWSQVASVFASTPGVIFDLFNEPYMGYTHPTLTQWSCWLNGCVNATPAAVASSKPALVAYQTAGVQQLVDVVRAAGAKQPILLGGLFWSGDPCGYRLAAATRGACPEITDLPTDPLHQLIVDFHTYLPNSACQNVACWNVEAAGIAKADLPIITGEFGEMDCSSSFVDTYMNWADQHGISYLAWTWNVNNDEPCTPNSGRSNHYLLQNWSGQPTSMAPDGQAFHSHADALYEESLEEQVAREKHE